MERRLAGAAGEYYAARWYRQQGYEIARTNYRTRMGEIDLILHKKDLLVFCEVKLRAPGAQVSGREAVDRPKQLRLQRAAAAYLAELGREPSVRFDVAEVTPDRGGYRVTVLENAFEAALF